MQGLPPTRGRHPCLLERAPTRRRHPGLLVRAQAGNTGAVIILPGFLSGSSQYRGMASHLRSAGFAVEVVPLAVRDWLPTVFQGESFAFYLDALDAVLSRLHASNGGRRVSLVGHSAGGWLARILLGSQPYQGRVYGRCDRVRSLVTLGTPHLSIEAYPFGRVKERLLGTGLEGAPPGVNGSSLQFANHFYPSADAFPGVDVTCLVGNSVRGRDLLAPAAEAGSGSSISSPGAEGGGQGAVASSSSTSARLPSRWDEYFAYVGYKSGCGRGDVEGDGVTPVEIAHLPGARNEVLPGVWHNPRPRQQTWYGDPEAISAWSKFL